MTMEETRAQIRKDALDAMRRLVGQTVDDDCADMRRALEYALKHGTSRQASEAIDTFISWKWAVLEAAVHGS